MKVCVSSGVPGFQVPVGTVRFGSCHLQLHFRHVARPWQEARGTRPVPVAPGPVPEPGLRSEVGRVLRAPTAHARRWARASSRWVSASWGAAPALT